MGAAGRRVASYHGGILMEVAVTGASRSSAAESRRTL
jgi:hypothetical protein